MNFNSPKPAIYFFTNSHEIGGYRNSGADSGDRESVPGNPPHLTFGKNMEEAYEAAIDAASGWLQVTEDSFIPEKPSTFEELKN